MLFHGFIKFADLAKHLEGFSPSDGPGQRPLYSFGPNNRFRVFYQVAGEEREVQVLAIGVKERNKLKIGREEVKL